MYGLSPNVHVYTDVCTCVYMYIFTHVYIHMPTWRHSEPTCIPHLQFPHPYRNQCSLSVTFEIAILDDAYLFSATYLLSNHFIMPTKTRLLARAIYCFLFSFTHGCNFKSHPSLDMLELSPPTSSLRMCSVGLPSGVGVFLPSLFVVVFIPILIFSSGVLPFFLLASRLSS